MVRHIVLWKLKECPEKAENAARIKQGLEALVGVIPGLLSLEVGKNVTPGEYDLCLVSDFTSKEALALYQGHPAHDKVRQFVHQVIEGRVAADYER